MAKPYVPEEIMSDILLRLPLETVIACKSVSKQFKNLINSPEFFNPYRDRSSISFVVTDQSSDRNSLNCTLLRHDDKKKIPRSTVHRLPINTKAMKESQFGNFNWREHQLLSGSSVGMICIFTGNGDFLLHNLITGVSDTVESPFKQSCHGFTCFGFDYDRYDDDYKIFVANKRDNSLFWVCSCRNRDWTPIKGFPLAKYDWRSTNCRVASSINGILHWLVSKQRLIVTYDLHTRKFGEILLPDSLDFEVEDARIGEFDGELCYWNYDYVFDLWVMKEYGVTQSWSLLMRVLTKTSLYDLYGFFLETDEIEPVGFYECQDGRRQVLLFVSQDNGSLICYDLHNHKFKLISSKIKKKRTNKNTNTIKVIQTSEEAQQQNQNTCRKKKAKV